MARKLALPLTAFALVAPAATAPTPYREASFTEVERAAVVAYWREPGRYEARPAGELKGTGNWTVRATAAGSVWIRELYRLRTEAKIVPTRPPEALTEQQRAWDAWLEARAQADKWTAEQDAARLNAQEAGAPEPPPTRDAPPEPGPVPEDLATALPPPPPLYAAAVPYSHRIAFEDLELAYEDNVTVPHKYAYYRFESGVRSGGIKMTDRAAPFVARVFERAGVGESERKVFAAVSLLEGGFDSVNTYDTGYVSVGFIQFAALSGGAGSLGAVLLRMKADAPEAYQSHFRRFGLDVTEEGLFVAVDPVIGVEYTGPEAAQRIIADKRLTAVFQRAGRLSEEFCVAQLATAKQLYYPAEDELRVEHAGKVLSCRVKDVFTSEAGLATLMDRKVNTGKLDPLGEYLYDLVRQTGITDLREAAKYEWALVRAMVYREDYLSLSSLSQPTRLDLTLSRGDNPRDRRGGGGGLP
jgi:hypothetical protein